MTLYFEMIFSRRDVNQNVLLNVDSLVLTDHALEVMKSTKVIQSFESGAAQLSTPVQLCCCYVALLHRIIAASSVIQGVFLTGTPPKNSKYKKVNLD